MTIALACPLYKRPSDQPGCTVARTGRVGAVLLFVLLFGAGGDARDASPGPWRMSPIATWFGGRHEYGQSMACGGHLTRHTRGIAHRRLPCGSRVELRWHGHRVVTRVVDRGPYPRLVGIPNRRLTIDMTARTVHDLTGRFSTVHRLRWRVLPRYGRQWR